MNETPKIAIVCDWLTNLGGAERVILDMHEAFPDAPIYTSIYNPEKLPQFKDAKIISSFIQKWPLAKKAHQLYLGLMPYAFESFDLSDYDIVLSSSFACSKGVITKPETLHVCYCHNPTRYVWDDSHQYLKEHGFPGIIKAIAKPLLHKIRMWDSLAAKRVDNYIANSNFVSKRIKKYYHADSKVIHPGVRFTKSEISLKAEKEDYYIAAGRLKAYKKFDLLVKAFNQTQKKLYIIGRGEHLNYLKKINTNPNTEFLGFVDEEDLKHYFQNAKALLFPQCEDFGIIPIEAQYFGCPVIAYNKGGATETVINKKSGILFQKQNVDSIIKAIDEFEELDLNPADIHKHAQKFQSKNFQEQLKKYVHEAYTDYRS
jgi:glycosyltransferase involved in cell wall biosynthesis